MSNSLYYADATIIIIFFIYGKPGAHSNTQTSFTNKAFVFSETARSEAVGMASDVLLISVRITILCHDTHSKCNGYIWVSGKMYGVKCTSFSLGM